MFTDDSVWLVDSFWFSIQCSVHIQCLACRHLLVCVRCLAHAMFGSFTVFGLLYAGFGLCIFV